MYPPPYYNEPVYDFNGPYDPYMRRFQYSDYPGSRYDDYPPVYGNDIDSRYYMRTDVIPPPPMPPLSKLPRKRTIYYAYLPEVVRSPPTVDLRYRSYDRYDPYYNEFYNYEGNMARSTYRHPMRDRQSISERGSMLHDHRTARPMKHYDDYVSRNSSSIKEKRFNSDKLYTDNRLSMRPYPYRRFSEFDPNIF